MSTRETSLLLLLLSAIPASAPAQTCTVTSIGQPCAARLNGSLPGGNTLRLELTVPGNTGGFQIVGLQRLAVVLPAGCLLRTDPIIVLPYDGGPLGRVVWNLPIPAGTKGTVRTQAIPILRLRPGVIIRSSNAIEIVCR